MTHLKYVSILLLLTLRLTGQSIDIYADLLAKNVTSEGQVNYNGFIEEKDRFQIYLDHLSNNPPEIGGSDNEKMAYWINSYNAFTIKLIIDNYPIESITDLHPFMHIPGFNTVWHKEFFQIDGRDVSLDEIEHEILRKEFEEYRIHFAINCASKSCPKLRNEPYTGKDLENQLADQTKLFLSDPTKNKISESKLELSRIFSWFDNDFGGESGIRRIVSAYSGINVSSNAKISYLSYDWTLNE